MVAKWVAGAVNLVDERRAAGKRVGAPYRVTGSPWRKVWHTMEAPEDDPGTVPDEGWSLAQTRAYIIQHEFPPHLWALHHHGVVFQTVPLDLAAYALKHDWSGYPETNHVHAIQTEVMGFARNGLQGELADWLGHRVLQPVLDAGVPIDLSNLARSDGNAASGVNGSVRFSSAQWYGFDGICGHQNVPKNSHWDPGRSDYARIVKAATGKPPIPSLQEIPEMFTYGSSGQPVFFCYAGKSVGLNEPTDVPAFKAAGVPHIPLDSDTFAKFRERYPGA